MKMFGSLATLCVVGLANVAFAGPVQQQHSGASQRASQCRDGDSQLKFIPGKIYSYKYTTKTETALEQTSDEKSTIYIDADVTLHAIDSCHMALQIESIRLNEEMTGSGRQASPGSDELSKNLRMYPLKFDYEDGVVSQLYPAEGESTAALNFKRGILSMLQNSMSDITRDEVTDESDVAGDCRTEYTSTKGWTNGVSVMKMKNLSKCNRMGSQSFNYITMPRKIARSSSIVNATQQCQQVITSGVIQSVDCHERHVVRPFKRQEKGAATTATHSLRLHQTEDGVQQNKFQYKEGKEQTLLFDTREETRSNQAELERRVKETLERLSSVQNDKITEAPAEFSRLVELLRTMKEPSLKKVLNDRKDKALLDALMNTMTYDAIKVTTERVQDKTISATSAKAWLVKVALATDIDASIISYLSHLLDNDEIMMEAHLAVSSLARTYLEENNGHRHENIKSLQERLSMALREQTRSEKMIAALKAIGNLGLEQDLEVLVNVASQKMYPSELRIAAMEAFRRFNCERTDRQRLRLLDIFTDTSDKVETRVAAYINAIACPTSEMITSIREVLLKEPHDSQVASFVYTHVKNLDKRSSWTLDVSPITSDIDLKRFEMDAMKYSKNYFYEMFFDPLDMGFEVEANSIRSHGYNTFMLNTTLDVFGHNMNIFDTRVRMRKDFSSFDGVLRFFGREVMYKNVNGYKTAELETMLKSIMSTEGLKFTRSMMVLDTDMIMPMGNGLPLSIGVNATATMAMELKAYPQGSKDKDFVAQARVSPSSALEIGVSMTVKAPRTVSGIRMVVTASSEWTIDGQLKMDFTAPRLIQANIGAPRDQSNLIDIQSNVYLVGAGRQQEIVSKDAKQETLSLCTKETGHLLFGHKLCMDGVMSVSSGSKSPFFLLRGRNGLKVRLVKTDKSLKEFSVEASTIHKEGVLDQMLFRLDTPGSQIDRQIMAKIYHDLKNKKFGVSLVSPMKKASIEGTYERSSASKTMQVFFKVDDETKMTINAGSKTSSGRSTIYTPSMEVLMGDKTVIKANSEFAVQGSKVTGDLEVETWLNEKQPIKINGEYSESSNDLKKITVGIQSEFLEANVASSVTLGDKEKAIAAEGHYSYMKGKKEVFVLGSKLSHADDYVEAEADYHRDGKTVISARGKYLKRNPRSVDFSVTAFDKQYAVKVSHETTAKENIFVAAAELDRARYASSLRYNPNLAKPKMELRIELPDGTEKRAKLSFAHNEKGLKLNAETDLLEKPYGLKISYMILKGVHTVSSTVDIDKDNFKTTGTLDTNGKYQSKIEVFHNANKVLLVGLGVGKDIWKPNVKVSVTYRQKLIIDASTEGLLEPHGASLLFTMSAPRQINGHVEIKKSGSLNGGLQVESTVNLKSVEYPIDIGLTSTLDLWLFGRSKKANLDGTMRLSNDNYELTLRNMLDINSWDVEWQVKTPKKITQKLITSGIFTMEPQRKMLRGNVEVDAQIFGKHIFVEPTTVSTEVTYDNQKIDYRTDVMQNSRTMVAIVMKASNDDQKTELSTQVNLMDKTYSMDWSLYGGDVQSGYKTEFEGKWAAKKIEASGEVQLSQKNALLKAEVESNIEKLSKAKVVLQKQGTVLNIELVKDKHFVKGDLTTSGRSFDGNVHSSLENWENVKASALLQMEPKMTLTLRFHTPKYQNNAAEVEVDYEKRLAVKGRVNIPAIFNKDLLEFHGKFEVDKERITGNSEVSLKLRGKEKVKISAEVKDEKNTKTVTASMRHSLRKDEQTYRLDADLKRPDESSYDLSVSLKQNDEEIVNIGHTVIVRIQSDLYLESQLNAKSSYLRDWEGVWILNKFVLDKDSIQTEHEFGRSPNNIVIATKAFGKFTNDETLTAETVLLGKWYELRGSVSGKISTDKKYYLNGEIKATSHKGKIVESSWKINRDQNEILAEGDLSLPRYNKQAQMRAKAGIQPESVTLEAKLNRDNVPAKTTSLFIRIPLSFETIDGQLKVQLPQELENRAVTATVLKKNGLIDLNVEAKLKQQSYSAQTNIKWNDILSITGFLKKDQKQLVKIEVSAQQERGESVAITGTIAYDEQTYGAKIDGQWTQNLMKLAVETDSNQWTKKHVLRTSLLRETKSADLLLDISQLKVSINSVMSGEYKLKADARYKEEKVAEFEASFNPTVQAGDFTVAWTGKKVSASVVAKVMDGNAKVEVPAGSAQVSWNVLPQQATISAEIIYGDLKTTQVVEATWFEKYYLNWQGKFPAGVRELTLEGLPDQNGKFHVVYSVDGSKHFEIGTQWTLKESNVSLKGHFALRDQNWRLEIGVNPKNSGEVKAYLFHKDSQVVQIEIQWDYAVNRLIQWNVIVNLDNHKHVLRFAFDIQDQALDGAIQVECPWIKILEDKPLIATFVAKYVDQHFKVESQLELYGQLHTVKVDGKLLGERITGTVETTGTYLGSLNGTFDGTWRTNVVEVKVTSGRLSKPIEFRGEYVPEKGSFVYSLNFEEVDVTGEVVYQTSKLSVELKTNQNYYLVATFEAYEKLVFAFTTPVIRPTAVDFEVSGTKGLKFFVKYDGTELIDGLWRRTGSTWLTGEIQFAVYGISNVFDVKYDLAARHSVEVSADSKTVFLFTLEQQTTKHLRILATLPVGEKGDFSLDYRHWIDSHRVRHGLKVARGDQMLGYEMNLVKGLFGSVLKVELPKRNILMSLDRTKAADGHDIKALLSWDHGKDESKKIEMTIREQRPTQDKMSYLATISLPKLNKEMSVKVSIESGTQLIVMTQAMYNGKTVMGSTMSHQMLSDKHETRMSVTVGNMDIMLRIDNSDEKMEINLEHGEKMMRHMDSLRYFKKTRLLRLNVENIEVVGRLSAEESKLMVRNTIRATPEIDVGYSWQGRTFTARAHWRPNMITDMKKSLMKTVRQIQDGRQADELMNQMNLSQEVKTEWQSIWKFWRHEIISIWQDLRSSLNLIVEAYELDLFSLRTTLQPIIDAIVRYVERIREKIISLEDKAASVYKKYARSVDRYSERVAVVRSIAATVYNELAEDAADKIEEIIDRMDSTTSGKAVHSILKRSIKTIKENYSSYAPSVDSMLSEHLCEFSSRHSDMKNKRCGMTYQLDSRSDKNGFMLRVPSAYGLAN